MPRVKYGLLHLPTLLPDILQMYISMVMQMVSPGNILFTQIHKKKQPCVKLQASSYRIVRWYRGGFNPNGRWGEFQYRQAQPQCLDTWAVKRWGCISSCPNPEKRFSPQGRKCEEGIYRCAGVFTDFKLKVVNWIVCKTAFHGDAYSYLSNRALEWQHCKERTMM